MLTLGISALSTFVVETAPQDSHTLPGYSVNIFKALETYLVKVNHTVLVSL